MVPLIMPVALGCLSAYWSECWRRGKCCRGSVSSVGVGVNVSVAVAVDVFVGVIVGVFVAVFVGVDAAQLLSRTDTSPPLKLLAARSCLSSPLKSPTTTE